MGKGEKTKLRITQAAIDVIGKYGVRDTTIRKIASEADVTEGLLYRYFENKSEVISAVWSGCMVPMLESKRELSHQFSSYETFIHDWIELSYEAFDDNPQAFSLLFLQSIPNLDTPSTKMKKENLFFLIILKDISVLDRAKEEKKLQWSDTHLAASIFASQFLAIPKMIMDRTLKGPANNYTEIIANASKRLLLK